MKALALILGIVGAGAAGWLAKSIFSAGTEGSPGFTGRGVLIADLNLALQILLVLGLTLGAWLARQGRIESHRINQTVWVLVNAALVVFIMWGSMADVRLESAADLAPPRAWLAWLHAALGAFTVVGGLWLVLQMNDVLPARVHIKGWKNLMRATFAGYWLAALLGLATWWVWYPGG
jgi:hypothetical protein